MTMITFIKIMIKDNGNDNDNVLTDNLNISLHLTPFQPSGNVRPAWSQNRPNH